MKHEAAAEFKEMSAMVRSLVAQNEERRKKLDRSCLPLDMVNTYQMGVLKWVGGYPSEFCCFLCFLFTGFRFMTFENRQQVIS